MRALVVDDDEGIRGLIATILEYEGFEVRVAASVAEAREQLAQAGSPDLAVLDFALPDGEGIDLCADLRSRSVPCLIVSAYDRSLEPAVEGADAWIAKPFEAAELVATVRTLTAA